MKNYSGSKFIFFGMIVLIGLTAIALFREVTNNIKIKKEISKLEKQAEELEIHNKELSELVEYLNSQAYQERAARESLNLQAMGEIAVALPSKNTENSNDTEKDKNTINNEEKNNIQLWWNYFFGINN